MALTHVPMCRDSTGSPHRLALLKIRAHLTDRTTGGEGGAEGLDLPATQRFQFGATLRDHWINERALARIRETLKPGGSAVFSECVRPFAGQPIYVEFVFNFLENFTGVAQVPIGFAGPILVNGEHAVGEFLVPLATTEGTLVASYNRGIKVLNLSYGTISARTVPTACTVALR